MEFKETAYLPPSSTLFAPRVWWFHHHRALFLTNCGDFHEMIFPYACGIRIQLNCISEQMQDWISLKLCVFSLFLIPTLSPASAHSTSRFPRADTYVWLWFHSTVQSEYGWKWSCFSPKVSRMEFNETADHLPSSYPLCSTDGVVPPCTVILLKHALLIPSVVLSECMQR